jgi:hypothetical protein
VPATRTSGGARSAWNVRGRCPSVSHHRRSP